MRCNRGVKHFEYLQNSKLLLTRSLDSLRKLMWMVEILFLGRVFLSLSVDGPAAAKVSSSFSRDVQRSWKEFLVNYKGSTFFPPLMLREGLCQ